MRFFSFFEMLLYIEKYLCRQVNLEFHKKSMIIINKILNLHLNSSIILYLTIHPHQNMNIIKSLYEFSYSKQRIVFIRFRNSIILKHLTYPLKLIQVSLLSLNFLFRIQMMHQNKILISSHSLLIPNKIKHNISVVQLNIQFSGRIFARITKSNLSRIINRIQSFPDFLLYLIALFFYRDVVPGDCFRGESC